MDEVRELVDGLTQRRYPVIEEVDGRAYFHVPAASAREIALLSLWHKHPGRMTRDELIAAVRRHHFSEGAAHMGVTRIARLVDRDTQGQLRLLQPGLAAAERLIADALA